MLCMTWNDDANFAVAIAIAVGAVTRLLQPSSPSNVYIVLNLHSNIVSMVVWLEY